MFVHCPEFYSGFIFLSLYYFYFLIRQAVERIDARVYLLVGRGDLGGEIIEGGFVLVEIVFPFVLLNEGEADFLLLHTLAR